MTDEQQATLLAIQAWRTKRAANRKLPKKLKPPSVTLVRRILQDGLDSGAIKVPPAAIS
jgi:hypothetical protein